MYEVEVYPLTGTLLPRYQRRQLPSILAAKEAHAQVAAFATRSHNKPTDIDTWHRRLGHVGYSVIERMGGEQVGKGINVTTYEKGQGLVRTALWANIPDGLSMTTQPGNLKSWRGSILICGDRPVLNLTGGSSS